MTRKVYLSKLRFPLNVNFYFILEIWMSKFLRTFTYKYSKIWISCSNALQKSFLSISVEILYISFYIQFAYITFTMLIQFFHSFTNYKDEILQFKISFAKFFKCYCLFKINSAVGWSNTKQLCNYFKYSTNSLISSSFCLSQNSLPENTVVLCSINLPNSTWYLNFLKPITDRFRKLRKTLMFLLSLPLINS